MKYTAAILTLAAAASAQDISIFPSCSLPCITDAVGKATTCSATDFACVCAHMDAVKAAATSCVVQECGADVALNQVLPATEKFCSQVGSGSGSSSSAPASSSSSAPPAASSSSPDTPKPTSSHTPDEPTSTGGSYGSSFATPKPTSTGGGGSSFPPSPTATSARPTSSVQTAGAAQVGAVVGGWGMLVLGAVAAL